MLIFLIVSYHKDFSQLNLSTKYPQMSSGIAVPCVFKIDFCFGRGRERHILFISFALVKSSDLFIVHSLS